MKGQLSKYDVIRPLEDGDHFLLMNGLYGALDVVDKKEGEALLSGDIDAIPGQERERLLARGHLCDSHETQKEDLAILAWMFRKIISENDAVIYLMPTYNCNFRCPYCFESHRLAKGEEWLKKTMSRELVDAVFEALEKEKGRGIRLERMRIYGGEPLLPENKEIIRYISKKSVEAGLPLDVTTNGYNLDQFIDILTEYHYSLIFTTLDGTREDNDKRRVHIGGGGSYEKILDNVGLALAKGLRVSVRINVGPGNIHRVQDLVEVFKEKGFTDYPGFIYVFYATEGENYPGADYGVSLKELVDMQVCKGMDKIHAMEHVAQYAHDVDTTQRVMDYNGYFISNDTACAAEGNAIMVDPEGSIYTCMKLVGRDDMKVGRVDMEKGKFAYTFDLLKWYNRRVMNLPECMECPFVFFCGGGCAYKAYLEKGSITEPCCGEKKDVIAESVTAVCDMTFKEKGEKELSKSLKVLLSSFTPEERKELLSSPGRKRLKELMEKAERAGLKCGL